MSDFRKLTATISASPQISESDVAEAKALGYTLILNNRPDGESPDQIGGAQIAAAARSSGLDYAAIPITPAGFGQNEIEAMVTLLNENPGPILAYCRSGTRSTFLWSLAQASMGRNVTEIRSIALAAGYDVSPILPALEDLAARRGS